MAKIYAKARIPLMHGTTSEWEAENPVLLEGEMGLDTEKKIVKVGDGSTSWKDLSAWNFSSSASGVQANWDEEDQSELSFIKNKPFSLSSSEKLSNTTQCFDVNAALDNAYGFSIPAIIIAPDMADIGGTNSEKFMLAIQSGVTGNDPFEPSLKNSNISFCFLNEDGELVNDGTAYLTIIDGKEEIVTNYFIKSEVDYEYEQIQPKYNEVSDLPLLEIGKEYQVILTFGTQSGASVNLKYLPLFQPNWNEEDDTQAGYILNKPTIGDLSQLKTTNKTSIVDAINELYDLFN